MPPRSAAHKRQMNSFPQILSKVARHIQGRRALCCPQFYASRDVRYTLDCTTSTRTYTRTTVQPRTVYCSTVVYARQTVKSYALGLRLSPPCIALT